MFPRGSRKGAFRASIVDRIVRQNGRHGGADAINLIESSLFGKRRTSPIKFASKGEVLSRLHARAKFRGIFKSTTGRTTTVSGHRQRAVPKTHPTPKPLDTRLRIVASFSPS